MRFRQQRQRRFEVGHDRFDERSVLGEQRVSATSGYRRTLIVNGLVVPKAVTRRNWSETVVARDIQIFDCHERRHQCCETLWVVETRTLQQFATLTFR